MTRPVQTDPLLVPGLVRCDGRELQWRDDKRHPPRTVTPSSDLLERFVRLRGATDDRIRHFASQWGILGICRHALPRMHNHHRLWQPEMADDCEPLALDVDDDGWEGREPILYWREWANRVQATLTLAAAAHRNNAIDRTAWETLEPWIGAPYVSRRQLHRAIAKVVQMWLELGGVRPQFSWDAILGVQIALGSRNTWEPLPRRPTLAVSHQHGTFLIGVLAVQLATRVAQVDGVAICSACGLPYAPTRRPAAGRRSYCGPCRADGAAVRDAKQYSRARLQQGERRRAYRPRS